MSPPLRQRERLAVFERDGYRCRYCGVRYVDKITGQPVARRRNDAPIWMDRRRWIALLHVDHVIPRCNGGTDDIANLVTACQECNLEKYVNVREPRLLAMASGV